MATLIDLFRKRSDTNFRNKVAAACWNEARTIFQEDPGAGNHAERMTWARSILSDTGEGPEIRKVFRAIVVLLQDEASPTDLQIQTNVSNVVDKFAVTGV